MGDVLHALPAVASLKLSFPHARLNWVVRPQWIPLLQGNPHIDQVIAFRRAEGLAAMLESLSKVRSVRPDLAIDFQGLIQSAVLGRLSQPRVFFGLSRRMARESLAALFYSRPIEASGAHRIERNLALAKAAGAAEATTETWLPAGQREGHLPEEPFVLASPFAGWTSKQWPIERYRELRALLQAEGIPLILNVAPSQTRGLDGFALHTSSVAGLIDATRRASAVIGVDSGPLHLAAALRKPGVAIYGPTDPVANGPFGGSFRVVRRAGVATTYRRDKQIHPAMHAVKAGEVFEELLPQLRSQVVSQ